MGIASLVSIIFPDISGSLIIDIFRQSDFAGGFWAEMLAIQKLWKWKEKCYLISAEEICQYIRTGVMKSVKKIY